MGKPKHIFYFILFALVVTSCYPPEEFSTTPSIGFRSLTFRQLETTTDSLILTIDFQDGDGDIGLGGNENQFPYHPFNFVVDADLQVISFSDTDVPTPLYLASPDGSLELFSQFDNRPPYNCQDYEILTPQSSTVADTFYIQQNENNKNIFVDFYRKINGVYEFIDWTRVFSSTGCGPTFDARFPIFVENENDRALDGSIRYAMVSEGFDLVLRSDTFQLRIRIKDRNLNTSNTVTTPDLTLAEILAN